MTKDRLLSEATALTKRSAGVTFQAGTAPRGPTYSLDGNCVRLPVPRHSGSFGGFQPPWEPFAFYQEAIGDPRQPV